MSIFIIAMMTTAANVDDIRLPDVGVPSKKKNFRRVALGHL
jgi:hypothetical protein